MNHTGDLRSQFELSTRFDSLDCNNLIPDNNTESNIAPNKSQNGVLHNEHRVVANIPLTPLDQHRTQPEKRMTSRIVQKAPIPSVRGRAPRRSALIWQARGIRKGAPPKSAAQRRNKGKSLGGRRAGFIPEEIDFLLELLEESLPLCKDEWHFVQADFMTRYRDADRNVDSLKRKFSSLHREHVPTGDSQIPTVVRKAKDIRHRMTKRADMGTGEELGDMGITGSELAEADFDGLEGTAREKRATLLPDSDDVANEDSPQPTTAKEKTASFLNTGPRPVIMKRKETEPGDSEDFASIIKLSILQDENRRAAEYEQRMKDREEERERRELERIIFEAERKDARERYESEIREARERRETENRRNDSIMQMMLMMLTKGSHDQASGTGT